MPRKAQRDCLSSSSVVIDGPAGMHPYLNQLSKADTHSRFGHYFCSNLYGRAPRGPRGVKISDFFLQIKLLSFCTRMAPKTQKLRNIVKIEKKCQKKPCFLIVFRIFFNLGPILARQTSNGLFSGTWRIF